MNALIVIVAAGLGLTGCHASRHDEASSAKPTASLSPTASNTVKAVEKSRDAMLDKSMDGKREPWTAVSPAASSTAAPTKRPAAALPVSAKSAAGAASGRVNEP